jgi:hypothetical protein
VSTNLFRHCQRCGGPQRFHCADRFRVNANGKRIDVWLLFHCDRCGGTARLPVLERVPVARIPSSRLLAFEANDPREVIAVVRDRALLRGAGFGAGSRRRRARPAPPATPAPSRAAGMRPGCSRGPPSGSRPAGRRAASPVSPTAAAAGRRRGGASGPRCSDVATWERPGIWHTCWSTRTSWTRQKAGWQQAVETGHAAARRSRRTSGSRRRARHRDGDHRALHASHGAHPAVRRAGGGTRTAGGVEGAAAAGTGSDGGRAR